MSKHEGEVGFGTSRSAWFAVSGKPSSRTSPPAAPPAHPPTPGPIQLVPIGPISNKQCRFVWLWLWLWLWLWRVRVGRLPAVQW